jgi:hypothetical protein
VPDELFDELMADLSGAELKVLLYIMRRTFGFKKEADNISLSQICRGITDKEGQVIDRGTGLSISTAVAALKGLAEKNIILATRRQSATKGHEATTYQLNLVTPFFENQSRGATSKTEEGLLRKSKTQETVKQHTENYLSSIRKASPKNEETSEEGQRSQPPLEAPLTESTDNPPKLPQPEKPREAGREGELSPARSEPKLSSQVLPPGLTRQYLSAARSKTQHPGDLQGLVSLASVLPQPPTTKRTYSQERQVLVDVIADLAREFRDEATLTESVSRAYNLMGKARITDIGVFTAKIYEARSITKERYGSIKRGRMPYFFSVLEDVCGQRRKPAFKPDAAS